MGGSCLASGVGVETAQRRAEICCVAAPGTLHTERPANSCALETCLAMPPCLLVAGSAQFPIDSVTASAQFRRLPAPAQTLQPAAAANALHSLVKRNKTLASLSPVTTSFDPRALSYISSGSGDALSFRQFPTTTRPNRLLRYLFDAPARPLATELLYTDAN